MKGSYLKKLATVFAALLTAVSCGKGKAAAPKDMPRQAEGVTTTRLDSMTLITLRDDDGSRRMPNSLFYGSADKARVDSLSPEGSVDASVSCFLVEKEGKRVLFDTGNGPAKGGLLLKRLHDIGVRPESVDYVLLTHMHGDHVGGLVDKGKPVFTHAEVYVAKAEYDYWDSLDTPSAKAAVSALMAYGDKLRRYDYSDTLPLHVKPMPAPGHTPGHTAYLLGRLLVVGDLMHGLDLQTQDLSICASFDMDKEKAVSSRRKYVDYAQRHHLLMAGMHFPGNGLKE